MGETWKNVDGYEGFYQVSNCGKIKSMARSEKTKNRWGDYIRNRKEVILKLTPENDGHLSIELNKNKKTKRMQIHRLVYQAFGGELKTNMCVHHIDHDKKNNHIDNLTQITYVEHNNIHSHEAWNKGKKMSKKYLDNMIHSRRLSAKNKFKYTYDLYKKGVPVKEISKLVGVGTMAVHNRIKRYEEVMNDD